MIIKSTKRELHKELMDYIDAVVSNMPDPKDNRTERAYMLAFECAMKVFFDKDTIEDRLKKLEAEVFKPVITESIDQIIDQIEAIHAKKAYKPIYHVNDTFRADITPPHENFIYIRIVSIANHVSPIDGKTYLYYECDNGQQLRCDIFDKNNIFEHV